MSDEKHWTELDGSERLDAFSKQVMGKPMAELTDLERRDLKSHPAWIAVAYGMGPKKLGDLLGRKGEEWQETGPEDMQRFFSEAVPRLADTLRRLAREHPADFALPVRPTGGFRKGELNILGGPTKYPDLDYLLGAGGQDENRPMRFLKRREGGTGPVIRLEFPDLPHTDDEEKP